MIRNGKADKIPSLPKVKKPRLTNDQLSLFPEL